MFSTKLKLPANVTRSYLLVAIVLLLASCDTKQKGEKKTTADSTEIANKKTVSGETSQAGVFNENWVELRIKFQKLNDLFQKGEFQKFQFFPYRKDFRANVRVYVEAWDENTQTIGNFFCVPLDQDQRRPWSDPSTIIYPGLSLTRKQMEEDLKWPPRGQVREVVLKPKEVMVEDRFYQSYEIFFDAVPTGIFLNPSPPADRFALLNR